MGVRYHLGALGNGIMSQTNAGLGRNAIADQHCFENIRILISVNSDPLEPVADFPYLGRRVAYNNSDWAALYQNLRKAWKR